ncbi:DnaJ domain-containing protein [Deinococcus oregonensis]|uniref:DnaJ domain-containing protein n=1 Tax=Deinococcus oregonensis TaxID=1805970 RepID=A0ABV6AWL6_9DEIO
MNLVLHVSNTNVADALARGVRQLRAQGSFNYAQEGSGVTSKRPTPRNIFATPPLDGAEVTTSEETLAAFEMLQLQPEAGAEEIKQAYRRLVHSYHPDKVAHLAPEFRAIAEKRMQEINAAHEHLIRRT